jgi:hypothetical protein
MANSLNIEEYWGILRIYSLLPQVCQEISLNKSSSNKIIENGCFFLDSRSDASVQEM